MGDDLNIFFRVVTMSAREHGDIGGSGEWESIVESSEF